MKKIIFKVNASYEIGFGHFKRCIALAEILNDEGYVLYLQTNNDNPLLSNEISKLFQSIDYSDKIINFGVDLNVDWVILDGYQFDTFYESGLRKFFKLFRIDDVPTHYYDCDVLLSQNYGAESWEFEASHNTVKALGLNYALISSSVRKLKRRSNYTFRYPLKLLITLGGASKTYSKFLLSLSDALSTNPLFQVTYIIPDLDLRKKIIGNTIDLVDDFGLFALNFDFVVTSAGSTMWELIYLGIPFGVFPLTDQQLNYVKFLSSEKICLEFSQDNPSLLLDQINVQTLTSLRDRTNELIPGDLLKRNLLRLFS